MDLFLFLKSKYCKFAIALFSLAMTQVATASLCNDTDLDFEWTIADAEYKDWAESRKRGELPPLLAEIPSWAQDRVFEIANRINGYEKDRIVFNFVRTIAKHRRLLQQRISRGEAPNPDKLPNDWHKEPWGYLYVDLASSKGGKPGDFNALRQLLDHYEKMGVKNLYILPHYASPKKDGGYDVQNHKKVSPELGGDQAFDRFIKDASDRGLQVIVDFVPGHVSEDHAMFQKALAGDERAINMFVHSRKPVPTENYYRGEELMAKYTHEDGRVTDNLLIFPDRMKTNYFRHETKDGKDLWVFSDFYEFQKTLDLQKADAIGMQFDVLGHLLGLGVSGIRADATMHWVKLRGTDGMALPETHAIAEMFHLMIKIINPKAIYMNEVVSSSERAATYLGKETKFGGKLTGAEADVEMGFEEATIVRHAVITGNFEAFRKYLDRKSKIDRPRGTSKKNPIMGHDEHALGFVPEGPLRDSYSTLIKKAGGWLFKNDFSGGARIFDLMEKSPKRVKALFKFFFGLEATPMIYYGDELGATNSWSFVWKDVERTVSDMSKSGRYPASEISALTKALESQDQTKPPQAKVLEPLIDGRLVHRGMIDFSSYQEAAAGKNTVYNGIKGLASVRDGSAALRDGGRDLPLDTMDRHVGSFLRRRSDQSGRVTSEVAVILNGTGKTKTINISKSQLTAKSRFSLRELESNSAFEFIDRGDHISISLGPHDCVYLAVDRP